MKLSDFSVLTFDCYGTLIDWESGMVEGLRPLTDRIAEREGSAPERDASDQKPGGGGWSIRLVATRSMSVIGSIDERICTLRLRRICRTMPSHEAAGR